MYNIDLIQKTIVYIEDHLFESLNYEIMGDYLNEHPLHINQSFTMIVGMNIKEYIHHRKMTEAAKKLLNGNYRLIDVANQFGFATAHEFSAAFSAHHDISPIQVRSNANQLKMVERVYIELSTTNVAPMNYKIQTIDDLSLVGLQENVQFNELNNHFLIPDIIFELKEKDEIKSLLSFSSNKKIYVVVQPLQQSIEIFIGVISERTFDYDTKQVFNGEYAAFQSRGKLDYVFNEIWHSVERQVDFNIHYERNSQYIYIFPEDLDFDNSFNKVELWLPITK
ncbi:helix-turn-helix domain-containing protein [Macrococcus animalis]|uniref:helix-turn-helix domain-containing protein n=1 Tax=Macrococcus animalis TaxID=3395467 RepID=UPI0039BDFD88